MKPNTWMRELGTGKVTHVLTPEGWQESDGDGVVLPPPKPVPVQIPALFHAEPSAVEMAANFAVAMGRWVAAGLPVASKDQHDARMAVCRGCDYWDGGARLGLGKCKSPGCGCSQLKHWLATERCPQKKWPA